jgi:hypothetical protein
VVLAEVAAAVIPVQVPFAVAMFKVASLPGNTPRELTLRVKLMAVVVPPTVNNAETSASAARAVLTLPAQVAAVSVLVTATLMALGDPVIPAAVTVIVAFPLAVIVPAAVAVST